MDQFKKYKKIAFVAGGGAAKALFYHIGVSLALKEYGIEIPAGPVNERFSTARYVDHVVGTSGGSIFGALVVNSFNEEEILRKLEQKPLHSYFLSLNKRSKGDLTGFSYADVFALPPLTWEDVLESGRRLLELPNFQKKYGRGAGVEAIAREIVRSRGLFTLARLEKYLREVLPVNDFNELQERHGVELTITATEADAPRTAFFGPRHSVRETGRDAYDRDYYASGVPISLAVQASSSVPGLFTPTRINGIDYLDGGVKKNLSTVVAVEQGADLVFLSHVITPYIYDSGIGRISNLGLPSIIVQAFNTMMYHKVLSVKETRERNEALYEYLSSSKFRKKYRLTLEQSNEMIEEIFSRLKYKTNVRYIYIPSSSEIFFLDYFNIIPYATRELIHIGYTIAHEVMGQHGFSKMPKYSHVGILEEKGLHAFICDDDCRDYRESVRGKITDA